MVNFFGSSYVNQDNWSPLIPENTGEFGVFGWSGVARGASVVCSPILDLTLFQLQRKKRIRRSVTFKLASLALY